MILTDKNRKHSEAIVKYCIDSGMEPFAANGPLWNHLVRVLKRMEIVEELLLESNESLRSAYQVASRYGRETNWQALQNKLSNILDRQHELTNKIRKSAAGQKESAPKAPNSPMDEIAQLCGRVDQLLDSNLSCDERLAISVLVGVIVDHMKEQLHQ